MTGGGQGRAWQPPNSVRQSAAPAPPCHLREIPDCEPYTRMIFFLRGRCVDTGKLRRSHDARCMMNVMLQSSLHVSVCASVVGVNGATGNGRWCRGRHRTRAGGAALVWRLWSIVSRPDTVLLSVTSPRGRHDITAGWKGCNGSACCHGSPPSVTRGIMGRRRR